MPRVLSKMIFDVRSLHPRQKEFYDAGKRYLFEQSVKNSGNKALFVIHPLYLTRGIKNPRKAEITSLTKISEYYIGPFLADLISLQNYRQHLLRFNDFVSKTSIPMFVFTGENERPEVEKWFSEIGLSAPAAFITTLESYDTTPQIFDRPYRWKWLTTLAKNMSVERAPIIGEMAYIIGRKKKGCVYVAHKKLSSLNPEIIFEYTYPNLRVPPINIKRILWKFYPDIAVLRNS